LPRVREFGSVPALAHPVQTVLESLYAAERCPRLHVNAMNAGVVCPDFIRDQWKDRLVIDLDASYPLALEMNDDGLSADLSFGGYVTRCSFPWSAIYVVSDRDSGRGIVLEQNVPASVRAQMEAAKRPKPRLAAVEDLPADAEDLSDTSDEDDEDGVPGAVDDEADDEIDDENDDELDDDGEDDHADDETSDDSEAAGDDSDDEGEQDRDTSEDSSPTDAPKVAAKAESAADDTDAKPDVKPSLRSQPPSAQPNTAQPSAAQPNTAATAPATEGDDQGAGAPEPIKKHTSEEQERVAQRRRAAFRVIDGGS
jgi:stringent starvation protein B